MWRKTPQTELIRALLAEKGHASNKELAVAARKSIPVMSDTTVHRITARLVSAGLASYAPSLNRMRIVDSNTEKHDHFYCLGCHRLIDIQVNESAFLQIDSQLPGKLSKDSVLVAGICQKCLPA